MGSTGFLLIFLVVNAANLVEARETHSRPELCVLGILACLSALVALVWQTLESSPMTLWVPAGMIVFSILVETVYRRFRGGPIRV
jgi:hypothetical protein